MASNLTGQVRNIADVDDRRRQRRPVEQDHRRREGRDPRAEEHHQHDGRPAQRASPRKSAAWRARSAPKASSAARPQVPGVAGTWKDLTDNVNSMARTSPARCATSPTWPPPSPTATCRARSPSTCKGEILELKNTINTMVDQLNAFASEVSRVAREVGTEGKLGGQARGAGRRRHLEGPDRQRQLDGVEPDRPGAQHRRRRHRRRQRRPVAQDHGRREGRDPRAEEHHQHDGRPAQRASPRK